MLNPPEFEPSPDMLTGCSEPTHEEVMAFTTYCQENTSSFHLLGVKQYDTGQVIPYDDPSLQKFLDDRITYASKKNIKIIQPASCYINQGSLGSCAGASGTGAQMSSVYNHRYFGIPAVHERLNCSAAYLQARGRWGSGLSIVKFQHTLMEFGNATARVAGEYTTRAPGTLKGFDNKDYQIWSCNCETVAQVCKFLKAGVAVAFASNQMPKGVKNGRVTGWRGCSHAMMFSGYNHDIADPFYGLYRWTNSWGKIYDDADGGWGCWMDKKEMDVFNMCGRYGLPYAIIGAEFKVGI